MTESFLILIAIVILASIWLNTMSSRIGVPALLVFMLLGLRGAASIVFAIMAMVDPAFLQNDIFNIVFVVVLLSVTFQGTLLPLVSRKLDMVDPKADIMKTFNDYADGTDLNFGRIPVKPDSRRVGQRIADYPGKGLIVLVRRGEENIIPSGKTILRAGDKIVILYIQ